MNVTRDPDAILAAWLDEGPTGLPESSRRAIAVNTRTTTQRRHLLWMPWRKPVMNSYARWAIAAIAILIAVGGTAYLIAPGGSQVGGPPTATVSPSASAAPSGSAAPTAQAPTARPSPSPSILASEGFVYPGTYVPRFDPPMTFTIAHEVEHHCAPDFQCRGSIDANLPAWIDLEFGMPRIEAHIFRVDKLNDPTKAGRLIDPPADLAAWIASHPGLTVIARKAVTVGDLAATQLDVRTGNKDVGFGPITGVTDPGMGLGANVNARLIIVPVAGRQVLIMLRAEDGSVEEVQPLVDSIVWR
jgi:hypothetical protein